MEDEINSIKKNDTWKLTTIFKSHEEIRIKQVYKAKLILKGYKST